ncbi:glycosyltransferase [Azospirillum sp. SYSU D00513]|uniref:glycosyltransferase family 2 protein n=1 Tax=Azospirillum sp. SYSU D00513 TaxID=2812561 RepID=UPI001A979C9E|nr:glycosyltransferase [Azospirillum sp. SYSU D00513]
MEQRFCGPEHVSAIIPVKDDPDGLARTLACLCRMVPISRPKAVIVVDDGSNDGGEGSRAVLERVDSGLFDLQLETLPVNRGPAAARNAGAARSLSDWLWFLDAGVSPSLGYLQFITSAGSNPAVAWTGPVEAEDTGPYSAYYRAQRVLSPPVDDRRMLTSVVTTSVVVARTAFFAIDGFDERFQRPAWEDIDFGLRLRAHGRINWLSSLIVRHAFQESESDFRARFERYGAGMWVFGDKWNCDMEPWPVTARTDDPFHHELAKVQYEATFKGWARNQAQQGPRGAGYEPK